MEVIKFDLDKLKKQKDGFSYYILGRSYDLEENDVSNDYKMALEYYYKGLELNDPLCEYSIGISYILGLGDILPINLEKGNMILKKVFPKIVEMSEDKRISKEKRIYSKFVIGAYYYFGLGDTIQDKRKAFEIISYCAKNGHIGAIYDLGANFYYNGVGTRKNKTKALEYLKIAKDENLSRAISKYHEYGFDLVNSIK